MHQTPRIHLLHARHAKLHLAHHFLANLCLDDSAPHFGLEELHAELFYLVEQRVHKRVDGLVVVALSTVPFVL
jgi:hypothetical protein